MDKFTETETIDGYWCDSCPSRNATIEKQFLLKTPPKILTFYLRRSIFCMEKLQIAKTNSKFKFPLEIDMLKYSSYFKFGETADPNAFKFKLKGVVCHWGGQTWGTCYSLNKVTPDDLIFVKDDVDSHPWLNYGSENVSPCNGTMEELEQLAFGNDDTELSYRNGGFPQRNKDKDVKNKSAYILFYERADFNNLELAIEGTSDEIVKMKENMKEGRFRIEDEKLIFKMDAFKGY